MTVAQALAAYLVAAGLLTVTPGLDTALILRTAAVEGSRRAALAAVGIISGCLIWGAAVALGLGALLAAAPLAFTVLKWAGCAYLVWLGLNLILRPRDRFEIASGAPSQDPKVGVFYISFLPQFLPAGVAPASFIFLLALIHAGLGLAWSAVLIGATRPIGGFLRRAVVVRWLDRITGGVFLGFGLRLALSRR